MAESDGTIADLYPPPPPYYEFFTEENVRRVNEWIKENEAPEAQKPNQEKSEEYSEGEPEKQEDSKSEKNDDNKDLKKPNVRKLPTDELQFLIPPEKPSGQTYRVFGNIWQFDDKMPSLKEVGIEQLYEDPKEDDDEETLDYGSEARIDELKKLFKSLLLNFLELIGIMSKNPTLYPKKLEQIRIIMINIHHLLNEYRPHQARESLILLLQNQINAKKNDIKEIESVTREIRSKILPGLIQQIGQEEAVLRERSNTSTFEEAEDHKFEDPKKHKENMVFPDGPDSQVKSESVSGEQQTTTHEDYLGIVEELVKAL